jgi:hypothetical protein
MKRGECSSISVDCPVEIVLDAKTLKSLIATLEKGIA